VQYINLKLFKYGYNCLPVKYLAAGQDMFPGIAGNPGKAAILYGSVMLAGVWFIGI